MHSKETYEQWAYRRHPERSYERHEVGGGLSELWGPFAVEPTKNNCTCAVCFVHAVQPRWIVEELPPVLGEAGAKGAWKEVTFTLPAQIEDANGNFIRWAVNTPLTFKPE